MTTLDEADATVSELLDRVLAGEAITLTRAGQRVADVSPAKPVFDAAWFRANSVTTKGPFDAVEAVRRIRDREE